MIRKGTKVKVTWVNGLVTTVYTGVVTACYGGPKWNAPWTYDVRDEHGATLPVVEWRCERLEKGKR